MCRHLLSFALLLCGAAAYAQDLGMSQASGTSRNPQAVPMQMIHAMHGSWLLMFHGQAFLNRVNESGPRGDSKTFSTNWFMVTAERPAGGGTVLFRTMLSFEPATISGRKYPELFQTGETAFGKQLIDAQHPHDFIMELAAEYARPIGRGTVYVYAAPVGEPALGPVAFPHRDSAMELPQAPLGHHFEDSTHIAFNVVTAGVTAGAVTAEGSAFHGREPDEQRWKPDGGRIDSWSARLRLQPLRALDLQVSHGRLEHPEAVEPGYATRTTASASTSVPFAHVRFSSTLAWGRVYKEVHDRSFDAWLGEAALHVFDRHHATVRAERADKDELFPHPVLTQVPRPPLPVRVFRVEAYTLGYTFDVLHAARTTTGLGATATRYRFPALLQPFYGEHPHSVMVFLRTRLG
jgi:hypothetical protein